MTLFGEVLSPAACAGLSAAVLLALAFQFINGFHDTANAVVTVIYTNTLKPWKAVIWSGLWNLIGVLVANGAVALSIIALLPHSLVETVGSAPSFAMVFAVLLSAIVWNLGTWFVGMPASSSHTLIGSILGVAMADALFLHGSLRHSGINWAKAAEVGWALLISPLIGFGGSALLYLLAKITIRNPDLYRAPKTHKTPPLWIRGVLVTTCAGVSFAHGVNDGQKGMGLLMIILIGFLPQTYHLQTDAAGLITMTIPVWVKVAVAIALSLGTMIGWKRIVVTVGEKIGKKHMTYAQGAAAEVTAMATILGAGALGLPVSTTHVLSSGIAGTMAAARAGLQIATVRNILLAWILTLPACVLLGAGFFASALYVVLNLLQGCIGACLKLW